MLPVCAGNVCGQNPSFGAPVGYLRLRVPAGKRVLAAVPFLPIDAADGCATNAPAGVSVLRWDARVQAYSAGGEGTAEDADAAPLLPGDGMWLENKGSEDADVLLWGRVVMLPTVDIGLVPGFNAIGYPYSASITVYGSGLAAAGVGGGPESDVLSRYAADGSWHTAVGQAEAGYAWEGAGSTGEVASLEMGAGYFYRRQSDSVRTWREERPYAALFPTNAEPPAVVGLTPTTGDGVRLEIMTSGEPGEKLDVLYQDFTPTRGFSASSRWDFAALDIPVNGADLIGWTDTGSHSRPAPGRTFGRCYLVARSDAAGDADGSGIPDARELFLLNRPAGGNPSGEADGDGDATEDGGEAGSDGPSTNNVPVRVAEPPPGRTVYVSATHGNDAFSGRRARARLFDGPRKTIRGGMRAVRPGDTLVIQESKYLEDLNIAGKSVSVRISGNVELSGK